MSPLADLQQDFARALTHGSTPAARLIGRVPPADALAVHRDTIMAALVNALRISYSTVDALVGEDFFGHAASVFAETNPPHAASLALYGDGFADFLAGFAPAATLAYLPDVARLDRAVETALRAPAFSRRFALDAGVSIELPQSLAVLQLHYPADEIRAALEDDDAMAAIVLQPAERFVLVWRNGFDAAVQRVDSAAGRFLTALLAGEGAEAAFGAAVAGTSQEDAMRVLKAGIFSATFCTVISNPEISP